MERWITLGFSAFLLLVAFLILPRWFMRKWRKEDERRREIWEEERAKGRERSDSGEVTLADLQHTIWELQRTILQVAFQATLAAIATIIGALALLG